MIRRLGLTEFEGLPLSKVYIEGEARGFYRLKVGNERMLLPKNAWMQEELLRACLDKEVEKIEFSFN